MIRIVLIMSALAVCHTFASPLAGSFPIGGEPFRPNTLVVWGVTNPLPHGLVVYEALPQSFSETTVSNAMAVGLFKPVNRITSADKGLIHFQDAADKFGMTRFLKIATAQGWMSYYNGRAGGVPVHGIPNSEVGRELAVDFLRRLGGGTNQIVAEGRSVMEGTIRSFDRKGGNETNKVVCTRGIILYRQLDGIEDRVSSFWINFGNDAKPVAFELKWRSLQVLQRYNTASPAVILNWIQAGRAQVPVNDSDIVPNAPPTSQAKQIVITKAVPVYIGATRNGTKEIICPYLQLDMVADIGGGSTHSFFLYCPAVELGDLR
jgi:hypothetical protein